MSGKILFSVVRHYDNVNIEDVDCPAVSDTFCLDVLPCGPCEAPDLAVYYNLSEFPCVLGGDLFDEQIAIVDGLRLVIPPGYTYCHPPTLEGGYFSDPPAVVGYNIYINGYLHITDPVAYEAGMQGTIILCDTVTDEECPAHFYLPENTCDERIWCMLMPAHPTITTYWVGPTQTTSATFSIPLHFVTGPECDLTSDTIRLYTYPDYSLLAQVICNAVPNPSVDTMVTLTLTMPTARFNQLNCLHFEIQSNCDLDCGIDYCLSSLPRPARQRSTDAEADMASSLELVPNPASNMLTIQYETPEGQQEGDTGIEICDIFGRTIFRRFDSPARGNLQVDVRDWQSGVYLVNLISGDKRIAVKKLVKQ